ncbi:hypothetical protein ACVCL3_02860 [Rhodanobacter sp. UC4437_H4]|jgi:hypothetical protein
MPTDRISPPSSLIETMRAMARDRASGARHGGKTHATNPSPTESSAPAHARQIGELQSRLRELARNVDIADPRSLAEARAPVLREILLWEFGSDFRNDSQFLPMVDAINSSLDRDASLQQRFAELIAGLQKT